MDIEYLEEYKEIVLPFSGDTNLGIEQTAKVSSTNALEKFSAIMNRVNYQNCDGSSNFLFGTGSSSIANKLESEKLQVLKADSISEAKDNKNKQPCLVVKCSTNLDSSKTKNEYEEKYERLKKMFEPRKRDHEKLTSVDEFKPSTLEINKGISLKKTIGTVKSHDAEEMENSSTILNTANKSTSHIVNLLVVDKGFGDTSAKSSQPNKNGDGSDNVAQDLKNSKVETTNKSISRNVSNDKIQSALDMLDEDVKEKDFQNDETKINLTIAAQKTIQKEDIVSSVNIDHSNVQNLSQCENKSLPSLVESKELETKSSPTIANSFRPENDEQQAHEGEVPCNKNTETKLQQLDQTGSVNTLKNVGKTVNDSGKKTESLNLHQSIKKKYKNQIGKDSVPIPIIDEKKFEPAKKAFKQPKERLKKKSSKRRWTQKTSKNVKRLSNRSLKSMKDKQMPLLSKRLKSKKIIRDRSEESLANQSTSLFKRRLRLKTKNNNPEFKNQTALIKILRSQNISSCKVEKNNESENCNKMNNNNDECGKVSLITRFKRNDKKIETVPVAKKGRPRKITTDLNQINSNSENAISKDHESKLNQTEMKKTVPDAASSLSQLTKAVTRLSNKMMDSNSVNVYNLRQAKVVLEKLDLEKYFQENKKDNTIKKIDLVSVAQSENLSAGNDQKNPEIVVSKPSKKRKLFDEIEVTKSLGTLNLVTKPKVFIVSHKKIETTNRNSANTSPMKITQEKLLNSQQTVNKQFESRTCKIQENCKIFLSARNATSSESIEKLAHNTQKTSKSLNTSTLKVMHGSETIKIPEFIVVESKFVTRNEYHDLGTSNKQVKSGQSSAHIQPPVRNIFLQMFEQIDNERCLNVNVKKTELRSKRLTFAKSINFNYPESTIEFANIVKSYLENVKPTLKAKTIKKPSQKVNSKSNFKQNKVNKATTSTTNSLKVNSRPSTSRYVRTHNPSSNLIMHVVQNNCEEEPESILPDSFQINSDYIKEEDDEPKL